MPPRTSQTAVPTTEAAQDVQAEIATEAAVELVAAIEPEPQPIAVVTARVLVTVTIGETRYQPNDIIADLPEALANSYAGALDRHPAAIELALADGGKVKRYEG